MQCHSTRRPQHSRPLSRLYTGPSPQRTLTLWLEGMPRRQRPVGERRSTRRMSSARSRPRSDHRCFDGSSSTCAPANKGPCNQVTAARIANDQGVGEVCTHPCTSLPCEDWFRNDQNLHLDHATLIRCMFNLRTGTYTHRHTHAHARARARARTQREGERERGRNGGEKACTRSVAPLSGCKRCIDGSSLSLTARPARHRDP